MTKQTLLLKQLRLQIINLEKEYTQAIRDDKDFADAKKIYLKIKELKQAEVSMKTSVDL